MDLSPFSFFFAFLGLGFLKPSSQSLEELDRGEGNLFASLDADGLSSAEALVVRRVALWTSSSGDCDFDCLPKLRGNWDLIPS